MKSLECKSISEKVYSELETETQLFVSKGNKAPCLAVILVGDNPASQTYVRNKGLAAERLGFIHRQYNLSGDSEEFAVLSLIDELNADPEVDGILVQLPLPAHINEKAVIRRIAPEKDVDGFSPVNFGHLAQGEECFVPCTPLGILEILKADQIDTCGKKVAVIGRSNIVGKPVALLLMQKGYDATVTVCNTKTPDLKKITLDSDIIIVATGHTHTIDSSFVKDGAVVIDVGINRVEDPTKKKGYHLEGDCAYSTFLDRDVAITPVPGGVGLMTVAMLMKNTLQAAQRRAR